MAGLVADSVMVSYQGGSTMAVTVPHITSEQALAFRDEGDREMDRLGVDRLGLDHRGSRYFVHAHGKSAPIERFLRSQLMVEIAKAALGETVYLFNEQYVVKAAEHGITFGWHQDSGFIPYPHAPYLTCWIALD